MFSFTYIITRQDQFYPGEYLHDNKQFNIFCCLMRGRKKITEIFLGHISPFPRTCQHKTCAFICISWYHKGYPLFLQCLSCLQCCASAAIRAMELPTFKTHLPLRHIILNRLKTFYSILLFYKIQTILTAVLEEREQTTKALM